MIRTSPSQRPVENPMGLAEEPGGGAVRPSIQILLGRFAWVIQVVVADVENLHVRGRAKSRGSPPERQLLLGSRQFSLASRTALPCAVNGVGLGSRSSTVSLNR